MDEAKLACVREIIDSVDGGESCAGEATLERDGGTSPLRPLPVPVPVPGRSRVDSGSIVSSVARSQTITSSSFSRSRRNSSETTENFQKLSILKELWEDGAIGDAEYEERKAQLIDMLTGTSRNGSRSSLGSVLRSGHKVNAFRNSSLSQMVVPSAPPDFSHLPVEDALKSTYSYELGRWYEEKVQVKLAPTPFAKGGLRLVYHLLDMSITDSDSGAVGASVAGLVTQPCTYVAKVAILPTSDDVYRRDVEMQALCSHFASDFNSFNPPRRVEFVEAWLLRLNDRGGLLCGVERHIVGEYNKHNNNAGFVSDDERNTPQAFSHFTFERSNYTLLVVDVQGVNDQYTDPQVHTRDGRGFGKGNLGPRGIDKFLATHRCNAICKYLKLTPVLGADASKVKVDGTLPAQTFMPETSVKLPGYEPQLLPQYLLRAAGNGDDGVPRRDFSNSGGGGFLGGFEYHRYATSRATTPGGGGGFGRSTGVYGADRPVGVWCCTIL